MRIVAIGETFFKLSGIGKSCLILMEKYDIRFEPFLKLYFIEISKSILFFDLNKLTYFYYSFSYNSGKQH